MLFDDVYFFKPDSMLERETRQAQNSHGHNILKAQMTALCFCFVRNLFSTLKLGSHCAKTCDNLEVPIAKCDNIKLDF